MPIRSQLSPSAPAGPGALAFVSVGRSRMLSLANCSLMQSTLSTWDHSCVSGGAHLVRQFRGARCPCLLDLWTFGHSRTSFKFIRGILVSPASGFTASFFCFLSIILTSVRCGVNPRGTSGACSCFLAASFNRHSFEVALPSDSRQDRAVFFGYHRLSGYCWKFHFGCLHKLDALHLPLTRFSVFSWPGPVSLNLLDDLTWVFFSTLVFLAALFGDLPVQQVVEGVTLTEAEVTLPSFR